MRRPAPPPGKVQAIGVMQLISGIFNLMGAVTWGVIGFTYGIMTLGLLLPLCCPVFFLVPLGIMEIISGAKHLASNHAGLRPPKGIAIAEVGGILLCGTFSFIFGILTLVFLNDPEVVEWYEKKRLEG
jgi:hypothetical protein